MGQFSKLGFGLIAAAALMFTFDGNALAQDAAAGEATFKKVCSTCHAQPSLGQNRIGPSLKGVVGRTAGTADGFSYSAGVKAAGFAWTEEKLDAWLNSPKDVIAGTKMTFAGLKAPADRANVIAFLKTQN
jgi:cytochrome c